MSRWIRYLLAIIMGAAAAVTIYSGVAVVHPQFLGMSELDRDFWGFIVTVNATVTCFCFCILMMYPKPITLVIPVPPSNLIRGGIASATQCPLGLALWGYRVIGVFPTQRLVMLK